MKTGTHRPPMAAKITTETEPKDAACWYELEQLLIKIPNAMAATAEQITISKSCQKYPEGSKAGSSASGKIQIPIKQISKN